MTVTPSLGKFNTSCSVEALKADGSVLDSVKVGADGKAVLMVSSDLRELMAMCDRIGVMHNGQLVAVFERGQWTDKQLLAAAFGNADSAPAAA